MMALGRGLGAILEEVGQAYDSEMSEASADQIRDINVNTISANPYQPRKTFAQEALRELSESIKRHGLLQPIVVIQKDDGFLLVAGERRLRAHKLAGLDTIKAIIADVDIDDARLRELALIENIQREDLNAMELAHSYNELIKVYEMTHDELSEVLNKSRSQITNTLRLLALSTYVQNKLIDAVISQGHAKVLVGLEEEDQKLLVDTIVSQKLSVRESEVLAKNKKNKKHTEVVSTKKSRFIENYKSTFKEILPFAFKVKNNSLEINFKNDNEIEKFLKMLQK